MNEWKIGWMDKRVNQLMGRWMKERMYCWMNKRMNKYIMFFYRILFKSNLTLIRSCYFYQQKTQNYVHNLNKWCLNSPHSPHVIPYTFLSVWIIALPASSNTSFNIVGVTIVTLGRFFLRKKKIGKPKLKNLAEF